MNRPEPRPGEAAPEVPSDVVAAGPPNPERRQVALAEPPGATAVPGADEGGAASTPADQPAPAGSVAGPAAPAAAGDPSAELRRPLPPPVVDPAAVPPSRPRRHLVVTRPRRTVTVLVVLLVVALVVPLLVALAARTIANSREGELVVVGGGGDSSPGPARVALPDTPGALLVVTDATGVVTQLVVLALAPEGTGGTVVLVPAGTEVLGPDGSTRLGDALAAGPDAQVAAVEDFLGVTLGRSEVLDAGALGQRLDALAPLVVDLPLDVEVDGPDGPEVLLPAGTQSLSGAEAAAVLAARPAVGSELDRLPNQRAVWEAVARRASEAPPPASVPVLDATLASLADAMLAGPVSVAQIPVDPVLDPVRNPTGLDLLEPDVAAARLLMARVLPGAVSPAGDGLRVRLLNPLGDPSLTYEAVGRLVYVGAHVILASEVPGPAPETSLIEFEAPDGEAEAARYGPVVGGVELRPADVDIDGVDATLVLGRSFERFMADERARQAASSAPPLPDPSTTTPES